MSPTTGPSSSPAPYSAELGLALKAAELAAQLCLRAADSVIEVERKSVGDFVSQVDRDLDAAICGHLAQTGIQLVSEELNPLAAGAAIPDDCWIIDPLDGSNAYIVGARRELVSCMIALRVGGETVLSVMHFPFRDLVYHARRGQGAFCGDERLQIEGPLELGEAWVALNHYGDESLETEAFRKIATGLRSENGAFLVTVDPPGSGLAVDILKPGSRLGAVLHDNNPRKRKQEIWDVVPPQLILEEAGAVFLNDRAERYRAESCVLVLAARSQALAEQILAFQGS